MEYHSVIKGNKLSSHKKDMDYSEIHIAKWKKLVSKSYILYDSSYMAFGREKKKEKEKEKIICGSQQFGVGKSWIGKT